MTRLNPLGSALTYSTRVGGRGSDFGQSISVASDGSAFVSGFTYAYTDFPTTPGSYQPSVDHDFAHEPLAFGFKLNPSGTGLLYSTFLGATVASIAHFESRVSVASHPNGDAYFTGDLKYDADFPATPNVFQPTRGVAGEQRSALVFAIAGHTVTVTQAADTISGCIFSLSPVGAAAAPSGSAAMFSVIAPTPSCEWSASSSTTWAQGFPIRGSGSATLNYTVYPNYGTMQRRAVITAGGQVFTISQPGSVGPYDSRFVAQMYFNFFGRNPSASEVAFHVGALNSGLAQPDFVMRFLNSPEFNNGGRYVAGVYVGILDRNAEYSGWLFQRNALARGLVTHLQLVSNFIVSAEFTAKFGNLSNEDFVSIMYATYFCDHPVQPKCSTRRALSLAEPRVLS